MVTEQDLREALAEAVEDPAAETFMLGLSDRALAEAGEGSSWRRPMWRGPMSGKPVRWVPGIAIGSAFAVAAAVGVAALGGGDGSGGGSSSVLALAAPGTAANPVGQSALTEFGAECFNGHGPKLALSYVWDSATQQYHGVPGDVTTIFQASVDGKRALVERGLPTFAQSWAVADWSAAVAGNLAPHPITDGIGVQWTTDGKEVVSQLAWDVVKINGGIAVKNKTADFYDPMSGRKTASVPIPQQVLAMAASGQWSVQQWQGDHDSVLFPLMSNEGDRMEFLNAKGVTVRTLTLQGGLRAQASVQSEGAELAEVSPDGRYLAEEAGGQIAIFDLQAGGKRIGALDDSKNHFQGWTGNHEIVTAAEESSPLSGPRGNPVPLTGHDPVYALLTPELKVVQQVKFTLPADPRGACATWPMTWAPKSQFPGAFVP